MENGYGLVIIHRRPLAPMTGGWQSEINAVNKLSVNKACLSYGALWGGQSRKRCEEVRGRELPRLALGA